jgi:hypothetical protein
MGDLLGWKGLIVFGISASAWKEIQRRAGRALSEAIAGRGTAESRNRDSA